MTYDLVADYDAALQAWPNYQPHDLFAQMPMRPPPGVRPSTTGAMVGKRGESGLGSGKVLGQLRAISEVARIVAPRHPAYDLEDKMPDHYFGTDRGAADAIHQMGRAVEPASRTDADSALHSRA